VSAKRLSKANVKNGGLVSVGGKEDMIKGAGENCL